MQRFHNKTVLVTGASRGIGAGIARRFAAEGARLLLAANEPAVEQVAQELQSQGACTLWQLCDVTERQSVLALFERAQAELGGVDVSIHNAGVITIAPVEEMTEQEWDQVLAVNTKGVFLCCQQAILQMRQHGRGGRIINTASGQARDGFIYTPHYAASKMGVVGITQSYAKEVAKDRITVNAFCPGIIKTDMWTYNDSAWGKLLGADKPGELMAQWVKNIPMQRAGTSADVAGLVTFLASEDAAYITGQTINVDGGLIMS